MSQIQFKRPKKEEQIPSILAGKEYTTKGFSNLDPAKKDSLELKEKFKKLNAIASEAVVFTSISRSYLHGDLEESTDEETDTASETEENSLPEPLTFLFEPTGINESHDKSIYASFAKFKNYEKLSYETQWQNLEKTTRKQSSNPRWRLHRVGRITASNCKEALNLDIEKPSKSFRDKIMNYKESFSCKATSYGIKNEQKACNEYIKIAKNNHKNLKVQEAGLHVNPSFVYLGASPDGITTCDCHETGLLEIKCPYKYKTGLSKGWRQDKNCPINEDGSMKESHQYYFQIQQQMLVTGLNFCDFFVWSFGTEENDKFLIRVNKNVEFCQKLLAKIELVFYKVILPELYTRSNDPKNENEYETYCICKRPMFKPMIGCDSIQFPIQWFHYSCAGITRAPKNDWFCKDCKMKK